MGTKRVRLSSDDIQFINELRGFEEPIYEVCNGREQFRPLLNDEELEALDKFREKKTDVFTNSVKWLLQVFGDNDRKDIEPFSITIQFHHNKKGYNITKQVK